MSSLFENLQVEAPIDFAVLPSKRTAKLKGTTLQLKNVEVVQVINAGATTITKFKGGQEGQRVVILGDGNSTVNTTDNIRLRSGSTMLLEANKVYMFSFFNDLWYSHQ